jgi:hypothetical protein
MFRDPGDAEQVDDAHQAVRLPMPPM